MYWGGTGRFTFARLSSVVMLQERPHFYDRHITVLNDVFTFLTEVGNAGRIVNTGTSSVNSEFVTALNTWADLMIFCPLGLIGLIGLTNFKNSGIHILLYSGDNLEMI
jgi:hypothetical protein